MNKELKKDLIDLIKEVVDMMVEDLMDTLYDEVIDLLAELNRRKNNETN